MYYQMKNSIKHEENLIRQKKKYDNKGNLKMADEIITLNSQRIPKF